MKVLNTDLGSQNYVIFQGAPSCFVERSKKQRCKENIFSFLLFPRVCICVVHSCVCMYQCVCVCIHVCVGDVLVCMYIWHALFANILENSLQGEFISEGTLHCTIILTL